jgi:hypothetical protein
VSFGITAIITDMIAKFLMFAKSLDRMDALPSQNPFGTCLPTPMPFWRAELSMDMLADVVVELQTEQNYTIQQQQRERTPTRPFLMSTKEEGSRDSL